MSDQLPPYVRDLLAKAKAGWSPDASEIDLQQFDVLEWSWWPNSQAKTLFIRGQDIEGAMIVVEALWIDRTFNWAITPQGLAWLYDEEESTKVRHLGG